MDSCEWFKELYKKDEEAKKIIGFIVLWMAFDDKINQWGEEQPNAIRNMKTLPKIQSFFTRNLKSIYEAKKGDFIKSFSEIPGGERNGNKRIALQTEMRIIYYDQNAANSSSDTYAEVLYALRNNFFHGSKETNEYNKKLICWAFDTLSELLHAKYGCEFLYFKD